MSGDAALTKSMRYEAPTFQPCVGDAMEALIAGEKTWTLVESVYPEPSRPTWTLGLLDLRSTHASFSS